MPVQRESGGTRSRPIGFLIRTEAYAVTPLASSVSTLSLQNVADGGRYFSAGDVTPVRPA